MKFNVYIKLRDIVHCMHKTQQRTSHSKLIIAKTLFGSFQTGFNIL